ncbi:MAG: DUF4184 family protein [Candidatus Thorarchaeota archaeon]|nr:DUF4184 family protein [Candidatus Thorarchaeota archaeon]
MPVTPLHYPLAWLISKANKKLILPALVVGSVIPDVEVPILWFFFTGVLPDHLILHSLVGGLTLGTILAVVGTSLFYPWIVSTIFGVDRQDLKEACKITPILVLSCFLGVVSHLLIDYTMHWFNPILWPWVDPFIFVGPLALLFAVGGDVEGIGFHTANMLISAIMGIFWIAILIRYAKDDLWRNVWLGTDSLECDSPIKRND